MVGMITFSTAPTRPDRGRLSGYFGLIALLCAGLVSFLAGCDQNDLAVTLASQDFKLSFGTATGNVSTITCSTTLDPCNSPANQVMSALSGTGATASGLCDAGNQRCAVMLESTVSVSLSPTEDPAFKSATAGKSYRGASSLSFRYTIPRNSLSFDISELSFYIAAVQTPTVHDSSVIYIDKTGSIAKGQVVAEATGNVTLDARASGGNMLDEAVANPAVPFQIFISAQPMLRSGEPLPTGELWLHVIPMITLNLNQKSLFSVAG